MDTLSLKGSSKTSFTATTARFGHSLPWAPGDMANVPQTFTKGTGNLQCDQVADAVDIAVGTSSTLALNLKDGTTIKDYEQANLALSKLKFLYLVNTGTVPLTIDPTTTNGFVALFSDSIELQPGNALGPWWHPTTGWTVDATHKIVNVVNADGATAGKISYVFGGVK